jgi:hypothetical protein
VGHAGGHDGHQFGAGGSGEEGADGERGFGLAHEDAGGNVGGLCAGGAHGELHDEGHDADDLLHEADVIKDGEERGDEDDGGEDGEGEDGEGIGGDAEVAEDERRAVGGVAEQAGDDSGDIGEDGLTVAPFNDSECEDDLETETPDDGLPANGAAVGGEGVGETDEGKKAEQTGESCQGGAPMWAMCV